MGSKTLRVGFVGAGSVNFGGVEGPWDHSARLEQIDNVEVVGIADVFEDKAKSILSEKLKSKNGKIYSNCKTYSSHLDMLKDAKLDAVIIGTAPLHRGSISKGKDIELEFVKAGVHSLIEKPLSVVPPEDFGAYVKELEGAVQSKSVVTSVGYMFRYHAAVNKMKELIKNHGGKVMAFNARYYLAYSQVDRPFWWDMNMSGGPVVEQATHFCDLARYLVGEVDHSSIRTTCLHANDPSGASKLSDQAPGVEDGLSEAQRVPRVTAAQWRFCEGAIGSLMHTVALQGQRYESQIEVLMDGLRLTLFEPYHPECRLLVRTSDSDKEKSYDYGSDDPYLRQMQVFIDSVRSGETSQIKSSYGDGSKTYNLTWAIRRAGETN